MKKKILITGIGGYIGTNLKKLLHHKGYAVYGLEIKGGKSSKNIFRCDIRKAKQVYQIVKKITPEVIIHLAGLSSLNECEKNPTLAFQVNRRGTENIVRSIKQINPKMKLIFSSSDYVFDGKRGNYQERDKANPRTIYGKSKLEAEIIVKKNLKNYAIYRTANVFGKGGNFFNLVLNSLKQNQVTEFYSDAFYTPTYIDYLLDSIGIIIEKDLKGTFHIVGKEKISRYGFARQLAIALGKNIYLIKKEKQPAQGLIALDSSLNSEKSRKILNNFCPSLKQSIYYTLNYLTYPYFYFSDPRGSILGITQSINFEELNYIESEKNCTRGDHYHKKTREGFYILKGKIKVSLKDINNHSNKVFIAENGDFFIVPPNTLHTFEIIKASKWINMLSQAMKNGRKDIHKI